MKSTRLAAIGALLLAGGTGAFLLFSRSAGAVQPGSPASTAPARPAAAPLKVRAVVVAPEPFAEIVHATGSLRAEESVDLQPETSGKITAINFSEGALVRAGQLLVKINDADLQASLERSVARRALAEIREHRVAQLLRDGGTNQQEYDSALSELNVARAEVELIEAQIARTEIRAPFDGVVGLRSVSLGAYVAPTTRIATLQKLENIKVDFAVPEKYAQRVTPGSPITFTVAGESADFSGTVYAVEPRVDIATRTLQLRAVCPNADLHLRPGTFAQVRFTLGQVDDAILVPAEAVVPGLADKVVFVLADGRAARRVVRTGTRTERVVQILEGLQPGEMIIVSGLQQVRHGLPVAAQ
ncbi:MAG: efflux RND transporter periplasmic adaptor subunit [Opitutaceae bacterium]|nr:efflux RND transporter periplasmic adaptor subunit [Opitutaceae bacterium]